MATTTPPSRSRPRGRTAAPRRAEGLGGPLAARLDGVDLARAIAIIGMIAVHVGPTDGTDLAGRLYATPYGRASLLFVLVAGVGVTLLARSRRTSARSARVTLLWRATLLLPAGLALQQLDHGVNVILQAYAVLFVVALLALTLADRWLLGSAIAAFLLGPLVHWAGYASAPHTFDRNGEVGGSIGEVVHGLVLSGPYPVVTWVAPLLFGMWLGRRDLASGRLQRKLMIVGAVIAVASVVVAEIIAAAARPDVDAPGSWWRLTVATPHSQMPLWLVGGTAAALAVLGASLWAAERWRTGVRPLAVTGQLALTVYVGHLLSLHLGPDALRSDDLGVALLVVGVSVAVAVALAVWWRNRFARGPLEALLRPPRRQPSGL